MATGQLLRLDLSGMGLTCPFPGIALANMRELRQLDLSDNALQVRTVSSRPLLACCFEP